MTTNVRLSDLPQWVAYIKRQRPNGTWAKIPVTPATGRYARVNDPTTWATLADARAAAQKYNMPGIGFVLHQSDPFTVIDLDACVSDGELSDLAAEIIERCPTYAEYSPSGKGVHIWVKSDLQPTLRVDGLEVYSHSRFCTWTGNRLTQSPNMINQVDLSWLVDRYRSTPVEPGRAAKAQQHTVAIQTPSYDDARLWRFIFQKDRSRRAERLYNGDLSVAGNDHSKAVVIMLNTLKFFTYGDAGRMKRMIMQTALPKEKWESPRNGQTWLDYEIENAISYTGAT